MFLCIFTICSCNITESSKIVKINIDDIEVEKIDVVSSRDVNESFMPGSIHIVGDYIVIFSLDLTLSDKAFYLYDKNNLNFIGAFINCGKASGEIFDLNPNFFYLDSDSTFIANTNNFYETKYLISDGVMSVVDSKRATERLTSNIFKIDATKYLLNYSSSSKESQTNEFVIQTEDSNGDFETNSIGEYPDMYIGDFDPYIFNKYVVVRSDDILSFYSLLPLIRRYDKDMNILAEYVVDDYNSYKFDANAESLKYFFLDLKSYKDRIFAKYNDNYILFDKESMPYRKFTIAQPEGYSIYCFDDRYIYILAENGNNSMLLKVDYNTK